MHKSKLIPLLKSFSAVEQKKFRDFINSPYYNKNKTVIKFFNELKESYPDFKDERIRKEKIYSKLFSGRKYNEQVIKNLTSELIRLCKEFLEMEYYKKNIYDRKLNLINQLNAKKLDSFFNSELKELEKKLSDVKQMSDPHFYYLYKLEDVKIGYHLERNEQTLVFDKVVKSGEYLVIFFILHLVKTISNLIINRISFNARYDLNLPEEFLNNLNLEKLIAYMKDKNIKHHNIVELYYYRVLCNSKPGNELYYFKFKNLLYENIEAYSKDEIYGLFNALETYCTQKINSGNNKFMEEFFQVFEKEISNGFYKFSENSPVTFMKFRNTCLIALRLKKYEWAEKFIEDFKNDLIEEDRESILEMSYAMINFEKGNYEKVLEHLQNVKTDQLYLKVDIRNYSLMSYYELNYTESVISLIDSYRHFITDNKFLTLEYRERNLRFVNSLSTLVILKEKDDKQKLLELKENLEAFRNDRKIEWIIEKLNLIET